MEEWKEYKLGDIAIIKGGKRLPKGVNLITTPNSHPYIRVRDLGINKYLELDSTYEYVDDDTQKMISNYIVNTDDIIISIVGTIGLVAIIGKSLNQANLTENCVKLVDIKRVDKEYLYYYLISKYGKQEITKGIVGAVQAKLPIKNIQAISIIAPEENTQKRIASILKSLDDKIQNNRKINENLEQQAQALFKSWFVDFEPFRDQPFVESELGMIPEGWRVGNFGSLFDIKYGKDHKKLDDGIYPVYGSGGLMRKANKYLYQGESVLIPRKGSLNNVMYVNESFWTVDTMFYTVPKIDDIVIFAFMQLRNKDLSSMNVGSAVPSMTTEVLNNIKFVLPTDKIMFDFNSLATNLYRVIKHNESESHRLSQLRDTLLPKLMSGEIKL